jgi:hypothetical protein
MARLKANGPRTGQRGYEPVLKGIIGEEQHAE